MHSLLVMRRWFCAIRGTRWTSVSGRSAFLAWQNFSTLSTLVVYSLGLPDRHMFDEHLGKSLGAILLMN